MNLTNNENIIQNNNKQIINKKKTLIGIISSVIKSNGIPSNEKINDHLNICDGFIFQRGDDIDNHNLATINIRFILYN